MPATPVVGGPIALPRQARRLRVVLAVSAALALVHVLSPDGGVADATYLAALGLAALAAVLGARRGPDDERPGWTLIALGLVLSGGADLVASAIGWVDGVRPAVSGADVLWEASFIAFGLGVLRLTPVRRIGSGPDVDAVIDSIVAAVVALLVVWELALHDLVTDGSTSVVTRIVHASYPVLDVVLLGLVVRLAIHHHRSRSRSLVLLGAGIVCWLLADLGFLVVAHEGATAAIDVGWMAAALLLATAVVLRGDQAGAGEPAGPVVPHRQRMWLVMVPLLVPIAIDIHDHGFDGDADPWAVGLGTLALIGLASWRGHRLLTEADRARDAIEAREAHFRSLSAHSADAVVVVDRAGVVIEASGGTDELLGRRADDLLGTVLADALGALDDQALATYVVRAGATSGTVLQEEVEVRPADGEPRWLGIRMVNQLGDPAVGGIVAHLHDVTERRRAQDALAHQAFHDALTGLANHALFTDRIEQALRRTARTGADVAVLYLDVDGFKAVNDRMGHAAGNAVLLEVAARLRGTVRASDTVARLGGDEFAVLIDENHAGAEEARVTAERILQALSVPVDVEGQPVTTSASIGLAVGDVGGTASALLRNADIAMYRAKADGKARIVVFDEQMGTEAGDAVRVEADLALALERGELELHYQPVLELATGHLTGFESLIRWRHPELGVLGPDRFIPHSESTGLIVPIGRWVLHTACEAAAGWRDMGGGSERLSMAVNLSAVQLATDDIVEDVADALDASGLEPELLVLEITETGLVTDPVAAASRLRTLRRLGVRLAIDDFGTGYSSLTYLRQFPVDILKIDRSFVDTITSDETLPPIVRGLLDLARTLDLEIIAEGIETTVQHEGLRHEDCAKGQGFYFSRPLRSDQVEALLGLAPRPRADA